MVEGVIARYIQYFQQCFTRFQPQIASVASEIARQCFRPLVAKVKTQATAIVVEVELVVFVQTFHLGRIDSNSSGNATIGGANAHGSLVAGLEIGLRVEAVHCTLGVEVITRLVQSEF